MRRAWLRIQRMTVAALGATVVLVADALPAEERPPLVLLPLENVSGHIQGQRLIMPVLEQALADLGYRVVEAARLEPVLRRDRIRNTGQPSPAQLAVLRRELGVGLAVVGSVVIFNDSPSNPQWGLVSRLVATDSGRILWGGSAGLTGDDFTGAFGLGTVTSAEVLAERTVQALVRDFPRARETGAARRDERRPRPGLFSPRAAYRSPSLDTNPPRRVAVLPFENKSERKGAGRIVTDIVTAALARRADFEVIEPGAVREALVAIGVVPYGVIDFETLADLRKRVEVDAVVLGTVFGYSEGLKRPATTSPEVAFDARMLDAGTGQILWVAEQARNGDDFQIALHFGKIRAMVPLVERTVGEMLRTL